MKCFCIWLDFGRKCKIDVSVVCDLFKITLSVVPFGFDDNYSSL